MRQVINSALEFGTVNIAQIKFDPKARDDIPKVLRGLQYMFITKEIRESIFGLLEKDIAPGIDKKNGRPGMDLWIILVLGVLRLELNCDYDRIQELANYHSLIRKMFGHDITDATYYQLQTVKDNVRLLSEELLEEINTIVVNGGHLLTQKKSDEVLRGRCDSFVVETNVHYPTDSNLLYDAIRKVLQLTSALCERHDLSDMRQYKYNIKQVKTALRIIQKTRHSKSTKQNKLIIVHQQYIQLAHDQLIKVKALLVTLKRNKSLNIADNSLIQEICSYIAHAKRQISQIIRRVIKNEVIPHDEKVFSIFEPHTEWISKGKAGVPVELGIRVCILEDHNQFILHHRVMVNETDDKVTVLMVDACKKKFPTLATVSYDKGFHSQDNQIALPALLETAALPRKGKLSKADKQIEHSEAFLNAHKKHSAVESAIHSLEVHGLDICPDHGIIGFRRYIALAIVTHNIHRIGAILHKQEQDKILRNIRKKSKAANSAIIQLAA